MREVSRPLYATFRYHRRGPTPIARRSLLMFPAVGEIAPPATGEAMSRRFNVAPSPSRQTSGKPRPASPDGAPDRSVVGRLAGARPDQAVGIRALVVESRLPRAGQLSSASYEGDGFVIVRHPDTAVVTDALRRLVTTVRVELG